MNRDVLVRALQEIADRAEVQGLCPTAPTADLAEGFRRGFKKGTAECVEIAQDALVRCALQKEQPK